MPEYDLTTHVININAENAGQIQTVYSSLLLLLAGQVRPQLGAQTTVSGHRLIRDLGASGLPAVGDRSQRVGLA